MVEPSGDNDVKESTSLDGPGSGPSLPILSTIRSEPTQRLGDDGVQDWNEIEDPGFDHPDRDHLWRANVALGKLRRLRANPNLIDAFVRQVDQYQWDVQRFAAFLRSREHRIAFVGSIGVGKSTAICKLVGLMRPGESPLTRRTVLETGGGRTTLCEVHLLAGPRYGLRIVPRTDESILRDVEDYAEHLIQRAVGGNAGGEGGAKGHVSLGISEEVKRAIGNMAGFAAEQGKAIDGGKVTLTDHALELAAQHRQVSDLAAEILKRMDLPHRTRREEWREEDSKTDPMLWMQDIFERVNNGRHPEFTLPERIEVVRPGPVLPGGRYSVTIIDTKGIDQTAARREIQSLLDDPSTLVILCSRYPDAPEFAIQNLLERAREVGSKDIGHKTLFLVLARPGEALDIKDDQGRRAESDEEGYSIKRRQIDSSLWNLGLAELPVLFYNAREEPAEPVREAIISSIARYRRLYRESIERLSEAVDHLISNQEDVQIQKVFEEVERRLSTWIETNREVDWDDGRLRESLENAIDGTPHASTVRATVNRSGDWYNLDYYHHLGHGARRLAVQRIGRKVEEFKITIDNAINDKALAPARTFLSRVVERLDLAVVGAYMNIQEVARKTFRTEFQQDRPFWRKCQARWGGGPGYRRDIREMTAAQLASSCNEAHLAVRRSVAEEWKKIIALLDEMLRVHDDGKCGHHPPLMIA